MSLSFRVFAADHATITKAVRTAIVAGYRIDKAADPTEGAREGLTADEAIEVAESDAGLLTLVSRIDADKVIAELRAYAALPIDACPAACAKNSVASQAIAAKRAQGAAMKIADQIAAAPERAPSIIEGRRNDLINFDSLHMYLTAWEA